MTIFELTSRLMDEACDLDWILNGLVRSTEIATSNSLSDADKFELGCDQWQFFNADYSDVELEERVKDVSVARMMHYYLQDIRVVGEALVKLSQGEANSSEDPTYDITPWRVNAATA